MIKNNNRRRPGTINTTPATKHPQKMCDQNQLQIIPGTFNNSMNSNWEPVKILKQTLTRENSQKKHGTRNKYIKEEDIQNLDLQDHNLFNLETDIDKNIKFHKISRLNLAHNQIETIPPNIFNLLQNMTQLYLHNNRIDKISFPYFKQSNLRKIDISCNMIVSLNLQHIQSLIFLECSSNQLSFLTLPESLITLYCNRNKLSSIYFMEKCKHLEEIEMSYNLLYDLKFNFKPYIRSKGETNDLSETREVRYKFLKRLDCSFNRIQYFQGMVNIINVKFLLMNDNQFSITRHMMNQLFVLQNIETLSIHNNPLQQAAFPKAQIFSLLCSKIHSLMCLNGQNTSNCIEDSENESNMFNSAKKSCFSVMQEPYQLFMESSQKKDKQLKTFRNLQWNFTLGDCQTQKKEDHKISDLSEIAQVLQAETCQTVSEKHKQKDTNIRLRNNFQTTEYLITQPKDVKITIVKSSTSLSLPHHIFYQPYLKALLSMSYVPSQPLLHKAGKISAIRLDQEDEEYTLIEKMFANRGGIVYIKKISQWNLQQSNQQLFNRYCDQPKEISMGFLMSEMSEKEFKQLCKSSILIKRQSKDVIGMQPNVFSCYHTIVRHSISHRSEEYQCSYLIESAHL